MINAAAELLVATVWHRRHQPKPHAFRYPSFYLLMDLDRLDALGKMSFLFSVNRFNLLSFHEKDHGSAGDECLRDRIANLLASRFGGWQADRILLLAMPRCLGFAFNPLSVFYAYDANGQLGAIVYEVSNTFGEKHSYVFRMEGSTGEPSPHSCNKRFHVSPFFPLDGNYEFRQRHGESSLNLLIRYFGPNGERRFDAGVKADRRHFATSALLKQLVRMPLASVGVVVAIHYEALRLWLKRLRVFSWPGKSPEPASYHLVTKDGGI
ncbi:DUF1365 domain-containing protein [Gimibacter soli]|uniref:DUF1365 domain-containing protein n=1 Tax=Gimibacter soli TaxID=3024400 RepID=A0AAE9XLX9_9PROT|nr:DUF1365 domain-containing protein [Gimibacter soli]WCL53352.1 DUF1365 domain-containing protein [Gimibacter soli]